MIRLYNVCDAANPTLVNETLGNFPISWPSINWN